MQDDLNNNPLEANQSVQPTAPSDDAVWVSREEYNRLRQAESLQSQSVTNQPAVVNSAFQAEKKQSPWMVVVLGALAVILFLSFATPFFDGGLSYTLILLFFGIALIGLVDYLRKSRQVTSSKQTTRKVIRVLVISALILAMLPVLYTAGMIIFFIIIVGLSGGRGS